MMNFVFSLMFLFSVQSWANLITLDRVDYRLQEETGTIQIAFTGNFNELPELRVNDRSVFVTIPKSKIDRAIEKSLNFSSKEKRDSTMKAYSIGNLTTRVAVYVPFDIINYKSQVQLILNKNLITLTVPRIKASAAKSLDNNSANRKVSNVAIKQIKPSPRVEVTKNDINEKILKSQPESVVASNLELNEDYLNKLIAENQPMAAGSNVVSGKSKKEETVKDFLSEEKTAANQPLATASDSGSSINLAEYGAKFTVFLLLVLVLFYGIVHLLKKGVVSKGKLGFLKNTKQIQVLNTTYIGPKRSLLMVKVHNKILLLSSSENGVSFISEVEDATSLLKAEEKAIAGNNFDSELSTINSYQDLEKKVKIKENPMAGQDQQLPVTQVSEKKERVKFSDQLKQKLQELKPLQ